MSDRVETLFQQASDLPPDQRRALLDVACGSDAALRRLVEELLAALEQASDVVGPAGAATGSDTDEATAAFGPEREADPEATDASTHATDSGLTVDQTPTPALREPATTAQPDDRSGNSLPPGTAMRSFGDYEIRRELGRGGMGVVYEARQVSLNRPVALKMVKAGLLAGDDELRRFRNEAEAIALLDHPGIVPVYEVGRREGQHYFSMKLIAGGSLVPLLDRYKQDPRAAARLMAEAAEAVAHAHARGILHRDLKPANILVDAEGHPYVTDFGLAKRVAADVELTQSGAILGTPAYMSPEQAIGRRDSVTIASDVYGLGAVFYALLTGRAPFGGDSVVATLDAVRNRPPEPPRRLNPAVPPDLEVICLRCLEKDPARRYQTAADLGADLRRWLAHEPILARPPSALYHLRKFARRHTALVGGVAATMAASVLGLVGTILFAVGEARQRGLAEKHAQTALGEEREAMFQTYRARLAAAVAALSAHDVADAAHQLNEAPADLRGWEWRHLHSRLDDSTSVISLPAGAAGFLLPAADRLRVAIRTDDRLRLRDLEGQELSQVPLPTRGRVIGGATETRDGLRVAAWVDNTTVLLLNEAGRRVGHADLPWGAVPRVAIVSPDGSRLASDTFGNGWWGVGVFDTTSGKLMASCKGHIGDVCSHAFSPDGKLVVTGAEDGTAGIWDASTGSLLATCRGHASKVLGVSFSPDGARLLSSSSDGTVRQWDVATGREVEPPYDRHSGDVAAAVYSPDGRWVASAGTDRTVRVWQATGRQDVAVLHGHMGAVTGVAFVPGGRRLASISHTTRLVAGADNTVRGWEVNPRATLPVLRGHTSYVYPVVYSPDGRWIASGDWDNKILLWDARTGEAACAPLDNGDLVKTLTFSPDGSRLVSARQDRLQLWDVATGRRLKEIAVPAPNVLAVAFRPDGAELAALDGYNGSGGATVLNTATGAVVARLRLAASQDTKALAYSPDGRLLAGVSTDDKTVCLFDAHTHEPSAQLSGHEGIIRALTFSPDSRHLASCSSDHTVRVWQIDSGECQVLRGHTDDVFAVAFHPDGTRLASAGRDRAIWLWDLAHGEEVARLQGHTSYVRSLAFSPGGATLASGSGDRTVRLWDTAPLRARYEARREADALRPEAERLVERLWRQKNAPAEIVETLRADPALSEPLRHAAERAVLRRAMPPESRK
jgi:WD40 repeat protein